MNRYFNSLAWEKYDLVIEVMEKKWRRSDQRYTRIRTHLMRIETRIERYSTINIIADSQGQIRNDIVV